MDWQLEHLGSRGLRRKGREGLKGGQECILPPWWVPVLQLLLPPSIWPSNPRSPLCCPNQPESRGRTGEGSYFLHASRLPANHSAYATRSAPIRPNNWSGVGRRGRGVRSCQATKWNGWNWCTGAALAAGILGESREGKFIPCYHCYCYQGDQVMIQGWTGNLGCGE